MRGYKIEWVDSKSREKVLAENNAQLDGKLEKTVTERIEKLSFDYSKINDEINRLKAINLSLDCERMELVNSGHSHTDTPRLREIFAVGMNNQYDIDSSIVRTVFKK